MIDADAFVQFLKDTVIRQKYENLHQCAFAVEKYEELQKEKEVITGA